MIEFDHLTRRFGSRTALEDLHLRVEPGEVLGLLGPNGAGKTTAMRILTGHLAPSSGTVRVFGQDVHMHPDPARRRLGYLPEGAPLWDEMTPSALLSFCGRLRRMSTSDRERRTDMLRARLGLGPVMDRPVGLLSRGMRRRVALAAALLHDPDLLVLDEPTDGLDPNQKNEVRALLAELAEGRVILISTHLLEDVESSCTRAAVIHHGRIVADGTPDALRARSRWQGAVTVHFAGPTPPHEVLDAIPAIVEARSDADGEALTFFPLARAEAAQLEARIRAFAAQSGHDIRSLRTHDGDLDEVFGTLTGRVTEDRAGSR